MNITTDLLQSSINFRVYAQALIGTNFVGCKVVSILDAETATQTGLINAAYMHSQVYPTIPTEAQVADDYTSYTYVKLILANGTPAIVGDAWIIPSSISEAGTGKITMVWEGMTAENLEELKRITQKNGLPSSYSKYEA